jgi:diaphanous 2
MKKQVSNLVILAIFSSAILGANAFAQTTTTNPENAPATNTAEPLVQKDCPVFKDGKMPPPPHDGMKPPPPPQEKKGLFGKKKPPKPPEFKEGQMPPPPPEGCVPPPPPPTDGTVPPATPN